MKKSLLLLIVLATASAAFGQGNFWSATSENTVPVISRVERASTPLEYHIFSLDLASLKLALAAAPSRKESKSKPGIVLFFPDADGTLKRYRVYDAPVMHPQLAAKYPDMKSYIGLGTDDPAARMRFSVTRFGLHSMTFNGTGQTVYIDPFSRDLETYILYEKSALPNPGNFFCGTENPAEEIGNSTFSTSSTLLSDGTYRTYRLAVSTTVEYSNYHISAAGVTAGTEAEKRAAVQAAIVVSITRVNEVYETDLAIHLELIADNDELISIGTDNFTNDNGSTLLNENQTYMNLNVGTANYDIGHIFSTGGGGIAQLGCVCSSVSKARGVTGSTAPVGDAYDIDYVAHEMGHQFNATHTFNGLGQNCTTSTRTNATAVEPGSGSTIMAYAGICSPVNVQLHSDDHFSFTNLAQISSFVNGNGSCAATEDNNNAAPVVGPLSDYTIPYSTPFILKGVATDADGLAGLTYCWEQKDIQLSTQPPVASNTNGPNFKSRVPSVSAERYMPPLNNVLGNNLTPNYEVIASVARVYNFALTVRDNTSPLGGQTGRDDIIVTVANTGPFQVTAPNTAVNWPVGTNQTVTWNVAGTTANNINTAFVDIYQGTVTGGISTLVASKVPNDGSEIITVPNTFGSNNRIMVRGYNNIFYDVSNVNFTVSNVTDGTFALAFSGVAGGQNKTICQGNAATYTLNYTALNGFSGETTFSATGNPEGTTVTFSPTSLSASGTVTVTVSGTAALATGLYPFSVTGTSGTTTKTTNLYLDVFVPSFTDTTLVSPADGATNQPVNLNLTFAFDGINATAYHLQVASDPAFETIVNEGDTSNGVYALAGLSGTTTYYWHAAPKNGDCMGAYSASRSFTTEFTAGIEEVFKSNFVLYPNPNNGTFTIRSVNAGSESVILALYDLRGRLIFSKSFAASGNFEQTINLCSAQPGVYLLSAQAGEQRTVKRIVIK